MGIGRFLIGSSLLFTGWMLMLSAAVTVVGLPLGLMVLAAALELLVAPSKRRGRRTGTSTAGSHPGTEGR